MTFQRSLFISFGFHILVCGSALAFAQYGHIIGIRSDTIRVSLVGPGQVSQNYTHGKRASNEKQFTEHSVPPQDSEHARMEVKSTVRDAALSLKEPLPDGDRRNKDAEVLAAKPAVQGSGRGEGSWLGILTPEQWHLIQAALERAKNYPRMARERGIEGIVRVRFKILPSGDVEHVEILKSSGHEILDSASIKTVYRSHPLPYVNGWVEVPISYTILK